MTANQPSNPPYSKALRDALDWWQDDSAGRDPPATFRKQVVAGRADARHMNKHTKAILNGLEHRAIACVQPLYRGAFLPRKVVTRTVRELNEARYRGKDMPREIMIGRSFCENALPALVYAEGSSRQEIGQQPGPLRNNNSAKASHYTPVVYIMATAAPTLRLGASTVGGTVPMAPTLLPDRPDFAIEVSERVASGKLTQVNADQLIRAVGASLGAVPYTEKTSRTFLEEHLFAGEVEIYDHASAAGVEFLYCRPRRGLSEIPTQELQNALPPPHQHEQRNAQSKGQEQSISEHHRPAEGLSTAHTDHNALKSQQAKQALGASSAGRSWPDNSAMEKDKQGRDWTPSREPPGSCHEASRD